MNVRIQFEAQLRQAAGVDHLDIDVEESASLQNALQHVAGSATDALRQRLLTPDGRLQSGVLVFVNEQPVPAHALSGHQLQHGDQVLLLPPISGG